MATPIPTHPTLSCVVRQGYVPGMKATASFYASEALLKLVLGELKSNTGRGGFIPAVKQLANVATLPGVVSSSIGKLGIIYLPVHARI